MGNKFSIILYSLVFTYIISREKLMITSKIKFLIALLILSNQSLEAAHISKSEKAPRKTCMSILKKAFTLGVIANVAVNAQTSEAAVNQKTDNPKELWDNIYYLCRTAATGHANTLYKELRKDCAPLTKGNSTISADCLTTEVYDPHITKINKVKNIAEICSERELAEDMKNLEMYLNLHRIITEQK